mgnify:FL=1
MTSFTKTEIAHLDSIKKVLIPFIEQNGKEALTWDIAHDLATSSSDVERHGNLYICKAWSDLKK